MRALVTVNPGWGHFRSLEPIARALELHGHDLAFATSPAFAPFVGETGFHTFPIGPAALRSDLGHAPPPCDPQGLRDLAWSRAKLFVGVRARSALPDLLRLALEWRPDVLVRDSTELAGCLVAETLGLPHASVAVGSFWSAAHLREAAGDELAALRHELGLPRDPNLDMPYRYLHLSFGPRWYVERGATWPPSAVALRTASEAGTRWDTLPDGWARLGRPPIVYGTLGTVANSPEALAMIVGALGALPLHAVVTVGRNVDPKVFAPWPSNVFVERYVPQAQLMPYCRLVVCHGGAGTVTAALSAGVPLVILPLGADQFANGARCAEEGVAVTLPPSRRSREAIGEAARAVLKDPGYSDRAQAIARQAQAYPGLDEAVQLLERLATEQQSLTSPM